MSFAAYFLENAILLLSGGRAFAHFLKPTVGFLYEPAPGPPVGASAAFPKENDKCPGRGGEGGWARLGLTKP